MVSQSTPPMPSSPERSPKIRRLDGPVPRLGLWLGFGIVLAGTAIAGGLVARRAGFDDSLFMEGEPVEMLQNLALAAGIAVFALGFWKSVGARALYCLIAFHVLTFALVRETPRCGSEFAGNGECLTATWKLAIMLSVSGLTVLALLARRFDWRSVLHPSNLRRAWPSFVIIVLIAVSQLFDKSGTVEIEEPLELATYAYVLCFAIWILLQSRQKTRP